MAQYNFEGAIETIAEPQLQFIHKIIVENGFENSKVTFEMVGKPGDNFQANVKRIKVEGEKGTLQMIAKIASTNETARQMSMTPIAFRNEQVLYTEVFPIFEQLQRDAGIPESEHLKYAKCYGAQLDQPHEVILLEDLKISQFEMLDKFKPLSSDCVKHVLKNFAILHSLSYVLKHKNPEKFNALKENLVNSFELMAGNDLMKMYFMGIENDTLSILEDPAHISCFKSKFTDAFNSGAKLSKSDTNCKYNVIQHGDPWTNNFLFKYQDGKVVDSVMVDYQQTKNYTPVTDILGLIFNCTDYETRKQNFYDWIDYYHSELDQSLANFTLKANYIYPRDKLDADLKRYGKLMFGLCVLMASMMSRKSEEASKLMEGMMNLDNTNDEKLAETAQQMSIQSGDNEVQETYKNKIIGLINSFTEFGLF
ncbi:unnamed protein product [Arctia plantaginis]|uniref:CHK kinase-like domain-containing protein n=1 Tax=Arctia plantaginis TaxID=874455 RepID=A0A8S0Z064_ARCPL|nr:unnamed protein product [Arctia plantaginis]